jgi:hypothetical protein
MPAVLWKLVNVQTGKTKAALEQQPIADGLSKFPADHPLCPSAALVERYPADEGLGLHRPSNPEGLLLDKQQSGDDSQYSR